MTQTAGGMRRSPAPHADRNRVEALIPTDEKIRKSLRGQWNSPGRVMNRVSMRYIEEDTNKDYFVVGWNGGNTISVLHEGLMANLSLTTLARRGVRLDRAWDNRITLGEVINGKELPHPVVDEDEVRRMRSKPVWTVCKGTQRNLTERGRVENQEVWNAYHDIHDAPITMLQVGKVEAPNRETAIRLMQEQEARGLKPRSNPHTNYSSRRGGVQTIDEMLGL